VNSYAVTWTIDTASREASRHGIRELSRTGLINRTKG